MASSKVWDRQFLHFFLLLLLLTMVFGLSRLSIVSQGKLLNLSSYTWLWLSVLAAISHQIYTWIFWRLELYENKLTEWFDDNSFLFFGIGFAFLGLGRFFIIPLAISNRGSLSLSNHLRWGLGCILLLLSIYLFYSIACYFSFRRAFGLDHFKPEKARKWSMVNEGIFRYTNNGMYIFGFLVLWAIGLFFMSAGALLSALFQHLYIWVHYYCTEKPDMKYIYG